jgi:predicted transcriptional regulator
MQKVTINLSDRNYDKINELHEKLTITKTSIINTAVTEFFNNDTEADEDAIIETLRSFNIV